jgi:uncharacterized protein (TIGR02246 family)
MRKQKGILAVTLTVLVVACAAVSFRDRLPAAQQPPAKPGLEQADSPDLAAVRQTAEGFVKAFNAGDAKALATFWSKDGEYIGPEGTTLHGRAAIETGYTEFFKEHPKARLEFHPESLRLMGRLIAIGQGVARVQVPGDSKPSDSRYSVLHVREDDGWKLASVHEWIPDAADMVSLKNLEWLIGDWEAKTGNVDVQSRYAWDDDKVYLRCNYTLKKDGKAIASGMQIFGKDPSGGIRSWIFDKSGSHGESNWLPDDDRWQIESVGTLPDGSQVTAKNILIPLGRDAFTWQALERTADGVALPGTPPVRVTRVKGAK